jgi:tripartite-type tricarboxylate transporter receptor subunit TctC
VGSRQAGAVQVTFDNLPPSIELIRADRLRALAVTSMTRSQALPIPTVAAFLPGYEASAWYRIAAPAGTLAVPEVRNRRSKIKGV